MSRRSKQLFYPSNPLDAEELLNYLEELDSDDDEYQAVQNSERLDIILFPPEDQQDSDQDDAPSDEEGPSSIREIGKGVLKQSMEVQTISKDGEKAVLEKTESLQQVTDSSDSDDEPLAEVQKRLKLQLTKKDKKTVKPPRNWEPVSLLPRSNKIENLKYETPKFAERCAKWAPIEYFNYFFDDIIMDFICQESKRYASKKGFHDFYITVEDLRQYFAIVMLSGYIPVASRRMYWETKGDTFNSLVSNTMSRNKFESIHRFLHFCDNDVIDKNDKAAKMRPLMAHLNRVFSECIQPLGQYFSLDEAMEPYYGRHSMKQFIRGKPIRFGFKFWCLTTSDGYLIKFDPYLGAGDKLEGKTLGSSVTEKMCLNFLPKESIVFIDNYFNSLPLLKTLSENQLYCVGTIRSDRVEKAPLKELKKEKRGSHFTLYDKNSKITLTRWNDNSQVNLATNLNDDSIFKTKSSCTRWSKKERANISVEQPSIVGFYNKGMGGVDRFDQMRALYRSRIRSKKWYWPFFRFCLNGAVVNMWYLYRRCSTNESMSLLDFLRRIVLSVLSSPPRRSSTGPKPRILSKIPREVRLDGKDHLIDKNETQRRCAKCGKCCKFICLKCNVGLHPDGCFRLYHET